MATCSVDESFLLLALFFSLGHSELRWPPIDLKARGIQCGMSSSYSGGGFQKDCHAAINGNTDRTYRQGLNCIHTDYNDLSPFWWVDMGQTYSVHHIRIYTRDGQESRTSYLNVTIDQHEVYSSPNAIPSDYLDINSPPLPVTGRYLRITRNAPEKQEYFINICEVEVRGEVFCDGNLASSSCSADVSCGQSSILTNSGIAETKWDTEIRGTSANCYAAINGNTDHHWVGVNGASPPNCFSTAKQRHPYWWLDLGRTVNIHKIVIHIEYHALLDNATVNLDGQLIFTFKPPSSTTNPYNITLPLPVAGRNISVQYPQNINRNAYVILCEVQIWGCPMNKYGGPDCEHDCSVHCNDNGTETTCDSITGNCTNGCKSGMWGGPCDQACPQRCSPGRCDRNSGCLQCDGNFIKPLCTVCDAGRYGQDCEERCSNGCNGPCNTTDGTCTCLTGWTGDRCQVCEVGLWGAVNCSVNCTNCAGDGSCDMTTGACIHGCTYPGWKTPNCADTLVAAADSSNVVSAAGGAVGALVVITIVIVVIVVYRRRRNAKERDPSYSDTRGKAEPNSRETLNLSIIGPTESGRAGSSKPDKPQAPVKPMMRSETDGEKSAEHVYGNVPAGRSNVKSGHPPAPAPKPGLQENTYTNVPNPSPASQPPAAAIVKAPRKGKPPGDDGRDDLDDGLADEADDTYNTADLYSSYKNMATRPELDVLQHYLLSALASGELLSQQFAKFAKGMKFPHNDGLCDGNVFKNRFKAMCAYDFNRVHLHRPKGDPESDYVNASYIKGCRGDKQYIATQGPRDNTVADLWLMVWQEKVTQMVMLTNIQEDGKDKCEEYWPASGTSKTCGHVIVEAVEEEQRADYVIRLFSLKDKGRSSELGRQVIQYHYNTWPDHGVSQAAALVDFWRYVKARGDPTVPLLVHCSAGVGRTGTFIALDIASEHEALGREVNVKDIVTELREQRCIMVQSESQYKFLHEVILEAHTSRYTRIGVVKFEEIFPDTITIYKPDERIDGEFKMLQEMGKHAPQPTHTMAEMEENRHKNRNQDALPDDKHLAYLTVHVRGRNQYINAVYMSSFLHYRGVLLTQLPIPNHTMVDFWRMVDGCDVKTVVSLGSEEERETVNSFCQYWPHTPGEVMATGPFAVTINSHNKMNNHLTSYGLTLKNKTENREHALQLFHYQAWAGEVPDDTATLLQLVDTTKARAEEDMTSPIVIQCIDGAARSGLFCAIYDIISRVTHDDEIDVYLTSRHVQTVRPQAVATETQYRFLYQVAQEYVRSLNVYQNVGVS